MVNVKNETYIMLINTYNADLLGKYVHNKL